MLDVDPVVEPTVHWLQHMARDEEERSQGTQTISLSSVSPPQSRYSARLRAIAPPHLSLSSFNQPLPDDYDSPHSSIYPPANVGVFTGSSSAGAMEVEPPVPDGVASIVPPISAVGVTAANYYVALQQLANDPVQELTPISNTAVPSIPSVSSYSPINPPPLFRPAPRELPPLTSPEWNQSDAAQDIEAIDVEDSFDDMYTQPIASSSRQSPPPVTMDPMSLLRAPSNMQSLLSPLILERGERPEDLEGFVQTCHQSVEHIHYVST